MPSHDVSKHLSPLEWAQMGLQLHDVGSLTALLRKRGQDLGIDSLSLALDLSRQHPDLPRDDQMFGHFVSRDWHEYYLHHPELMPNDPMAKHLFSREGPAFWKDGHARAITLANADERDLLGRVQDFGMRETLGFSYFDRTSGTMSAFLCVNRTKGRDFAGLMLPHLGQLELAGQFLVEGLHLRAARDTDILARLSPRERDCLSWTSVGLSTKQTAARMGLSDHSVQTYTRSAARKLGATTRAQACLRAYILGLIRP